MASRSQQPITLPGRSALHEQKAKFTANPGGGEPGLVFSEIEHLGKLNLRTDALPSKPIKSITGCAFPPAANKFSKAGGRYVVWLGPNEFLIICEAGKDEELANTLSNALENQHCAVTNITDALTALNLRGNAIRQILAKGCAIDFHPKKFKPGDSAQTLLSQVAITLLALSDNEFMVMCRSSYSPYLYDWLCDAAVEYGVKYSK